MSALHGREVVIVEAVRTAIGRGHREKGVFRDVHPNALLGATYTEVISRAGIDPATVDQVICGCVQQFGEQSTNIGRNAWLQAGLPDTVPAQTVDAQCGSAQMAVNNAAALIASGAADIVVGAGVEHMGRIPLGSQQKVSEDFGTPHPPELMDRYQLVGQGLAAEAVAAKWEIGRPELDELALRSHQLAARATDEGRFDREIVAVQTPDGPVARDQGIRPDTSLEALAGLRSAFVEDGRITAGNSSQISDGAASVLLMSADKAKELGLTARARILDQTMTGVDPVLMLTGPITATQQLLERNKIGIGDVDLFEVNEAFAPVVAAWGRELSADMGRVNVNGGAMALGHPLGSSGARLIATLLHELERSDQETGIVTMCCAGGLGTGTLIGRV
ncbi:MAG TPA: thiolase family protein [Baekduia sp.]|jgi:acetyl-CoA acetyltransferase family protein